MKTRIRLIILAILAAFFLSSCSNDITIVSDNTFALDTIIQIKLYYKNEKSADESLISDAFSLIHDLEDTLSVHIEGSELYNIKENAGKEPSSVSDITYSVIEESIKFSELTNGLFDVTAGPLIDLWAIDPPYGHVPTDEELDAALSLINYKKIILSDNNDVFLKDSGMIINLGAIAKGTIADEVKSFLMENGVKSAFINLGGNVLLIGNKPDGSDFSIGIQNPFDDRGEYLIALSADDVAIVSSGDYERFFEYEGVIYHHILNTKTGYPAQTNIKQVSIIAPNSQMADALSTSVLLLGIKDGLELINSFDDVGAIFITKDQKIYITEDLREKIEFADGQMDDFTVIDDAQELY
ncbi:MAG: FAD:protein FMN transferase [Eubacteriales bacterium]